MDTTAESRAGYSAEKSSGLTASVTHGFWATNCRGELAQSVTLGEFMGRPTAAVLTPSDSDLSRARPRDLH